MGAVADTGTPNKSLMVPVERRASGSSSRPFLWTVPLSLNLPFAFPAADPFLLSFILAFIYTVLSPLSSSLLSGHKSLPLPRPLSEAHTRHRGSSYRLLGWISLCACVHGHVVCLCAPVNINLCACEEGRRKQVGGPGFGGWMSCPCF